jgi:hypothetical protein
MAAAGFGKCLQVLNPPILIQFSFECEGSAREDHVWRVGQGSATWEDHMSRVCQGSARQEDHMSSVC